MFLGHTKFLTVYELIYGQKIAQRLITDIMPLVSRNTVRHVQIYVEIWQ